jgi:hypothetical protein
MRTGGKGMPGYGYQKYFHLERGFSMGYDELKQDMLFYV